MSTFLVDLCNELTFLSQLKFVRQLNFSVPYEYSQENELLIVLSKLPELQDLELNLESKGYVFKEVAMKFVQSTFKLKNLTFRFCHPKTFIFHPYDLLELNKSRSSISYASPIVMRMDYRTDPDFVKPVFIHPANPVLTLKFTTLHGDQEL